MKNGIKFVMAIIVIAIPVIIILQARTGITQELPGIDIPMSQMNKKMQIYIPPDNDFILGSGLLVRLRNSSDSTIALPENYGIHVFTQDGDQWVEVRNAYAYPPGEKNVVPKDQQSNEGMRIYLAPDLSAKQSVSVRIVIVGTINQDNIFLKKRVGAFTDVTLVP
jgi:hypothetical protein